MLENLSLPIKETNKRYIFPLKKIFRHFMNSKIHECLGNHYSLYGLASIKPKTGSSQTPSGSVTEEQSFSQPHSQTISSSETVSLLPLNLFFFGIALFKKYSWGTWLAQSGEHRSLDLGVIVLSPTLDAKIT